MHISYHSTQNKGTEILSKGWQVHSSHFQKAHLSNCFYICELDTQALSSQQYFTYVQNAIKTYAEKLRSWHALFC